MIKSVVVGLGIVVTASSSVMAASIPWDGFLIRDSGTLGNAVYTESASGNGITATIPDGGDKIGYGTAVYNGQTLGTLSTVNYTRLDSGSKEPYFNIWVTDGTNAAIVAPVANMSNAGGYTSLDIRGLSLSTLGFNVYENTAGSNYNWLFAGSHTAAQALVKSDGTIVTLGDIAGLAIYGNTTFGGSGAAKAGTGLNLIFGDTQSNFNSPIAYQIENLDVAVTPLPAAGWAGLALLGKLGFGRRRRTV